MKCIVPLAGPDLFHEDYGFRPQAQHEGKAVLEQALNTRSWRPALAGGDYIFVTRAVPNIESLEAWISSTWRGCSILRLPSLTGGALYTALAGTALVDEDDILIVDLADILFTEGPKDLKTWFPSGVGATVPCFSSTEPIFSYLREENGEVVEATEKKVISHAATAGVYMFRDATTFIDAAAHSVRNRASLAYGGVLFICPMINGVLAAGLKVNAPRLRSVVPVGRMFHMRDKPL